jgi:ribonuclease HI
MIVAYIDGGARGNPGPAGYGVRIEQADGTLVEEFGEAIGVATNNVAEYRALISALEWARRHEHRVLHVRSDSLLLVQQMLGHFKVKNAGLQPLQAKASMLARAIGRVTFEHVGRALNAHADRLANQAMDAAVVSSPQSPVAGAADFFTPTERSVRLFVYRHFVETTRAPDTATIAKGLNAAERTVAAALRKLADLHALVLAPASLDIWMAHPFSAVPTAYPVVTGGRRYWANCAWDAAGVLALVGGDGETHTRCADCGTELSMSVRGGRMIGDGVVHFAVPPRRFWDNVAYT